MTAPPDKTIFYQYLGLHSLLIGIFPFYLPVYLWKQGFGLADICLFISCAGAGFCLGLWLWDRARLRFSLRAIIAVSLLLEIGLLFNAQLLAMERPALLTLGGTYGLYNCVYWTTQRALFFDLIDVESSGRKYGNFQIFVGALLQVGIVVGGVLLEKTSFVYLLAASAVVAAGGGWALARIPLRYPDTLAARRSLGLGDIMRFKDTDNSRFMFALDGFFLFAESFFWVITLFLLAHESFATLGIMVLSLAAVFGLLFFFLKNTIDRLGRNRVYRLAALLYAASWALRAVIDDQMPLEALYVFLVVITFCTTFFRLAMNKRFYDLAKLTCGHDYLVLKSYYSQFCITVGFALLAAGMGYWGGGAERLEPIYWALGALSFSYLVYGARRYRA